MERLVWGGEGLGRAGGKVVFIPRTAPGDVARVRIVEDRRSFCRGQVVELVKADPGRVRPRCPVFGDCGGCQWQHLAYDVQRAAKRDILADALRRVGRLEPPGGTELFPSPRQYRYRHRGRLHVSQGPGGTALGFFRSRSHEVVPLQKCLLLHESLDKVRNGLRRIIDAHPSKFEGFSHLDLSTDFAGRRVSLAIHRPGGRMDFPGELTGLLDALGRREGLEINPGDGFDFPLALGPGDTPLQASGGAFSQVNLALNGHLVEEVVSLLSPAPGDRVLDLYCGIGNFSVPAATAGAEVLGVDLSGPAVRSARANAERLGAGHAEFHQGRADEVAGALAGRGETFDAAVLNPPRTGCRDTVNSLDTLSPSRIVMVSCDPATFSRDASLLASRGYRLAALRALDLFPQTFHFETVGLFRR